MWVSFGFGEHMKLTASFNIAFSEENQGRVAYSLVSDPASDALKSNVASAGLELYWGKWVGFNISINTL